MEELTEATVHPDPIEQFRAWYKAAVLPEPDGVTLATATPQGRPSARMVLVKTVDERGFVFYTNYESRKGQELAQNPWASLVFFWPQLYRQIRVEGRVERVTAEESDAYFASRPRGSQIAAHASRQSSVIPSRDTLESRVRALEEQFEDSQVPRPDYWGGYRLVPHVVEFWQGQRDRLHDRVRYGRLDDGTWIIERQSP